MRRLKTEEGLQQSVIDCAGFRVPVTSGVLWTPKQRQMHPLHYAFSYRACFKPELPEFLIRRYSQPGELVYDPFCGRGTAILQANIMGRRAIANDLNPLAIKVTYAKTHPVGPDDVERRLQGLKINYDRNCAEKNDLAMFYHWKTLSELLAVQQLVQAKYDRIGRWIEMLTMSRMHGHRIGFFSVYTFPQFAVARHKQERINRTKGQEPEYRPVVERILKKAHGLAKKSLPEGFWETVRENRYYNQNGCHNRYVASGSVDFVVTSPPFLDKAEYHSDNWLECWFAGISTERLRKRLSFFSSMEKWKRFVDELLAEVCRVLRPGGHAAIEVGDVEWNGRRVHLDEVVLQRLSKLQHNGSGCVLEPLHLYINNARFSKISHCFGVKNNERGTNTNRILVFKKCVSNYNTTFAFKMVY